MPRSRMFPATGSRWPRTSAAETAAAAGSPRAAMTNRRTAVRLAGRGPFSAGVRRRAFRWFRAAAMGAGRKDSSAGLGHDERRSLNRGTICGAASTGPRVTFPWSGWRSARSAASPPWPPGTCYRRTSSGASWSWWRIPLAKSGALRNSCYASHSLTACCSANLQVGILESQDAGLKTGAA